MVVITISVLLSVLGVKPYFTQNGIDYQALLVFCFVWGMGGAFISLQLSRWMAKRMMGISVIDPQNPGQYAGLVQMMNRLAQTANLPKTPEIGVFESPEVNAFATGPSKSRSLVAFSTGILRTMKPDELEGVAGHEIAHIANGDMVTMTLIQGVINAFVMFFARILAFALTSAGSSDDRRPTMSTYLLTTVLEIAFSLLGMIVVAWFSRQREFRADAGSARYCGRNKMIGALQTLEQAFNNRLMAPTGGNSLTAMKISGPRSGFAALFSTHPPLADRIEALKKMSA